MFVYRFTHFNLEGKDMQKNEELATMTAEKLQGDGETLF